MSNRRERFREVALTLMIVAVIALSGCTFGDRFGEAGLGAPPTETVQRPGEVKYYRSDEPLKLGLEHFERGNFGLAERYCREAVEVAPNDPTAWNCLAATYDRLGRFDLSDKCYNEVIRLSGTSISTLNNQGYSYMLRGDYAKARAKFLEAYKRDPQNPVIINNLALLDSSNWSVIRAPAP